MSTDRQGRDPYFKLSGRKASAAANRAADQEGTSNETPEGSITPMDEIASYEVAEGLFFRPVFTQNMSFNFVTFPPYSGFPTHAHTEEQVSIVREGTMEITIADSTQTVRPGDVIIFPPNVPHSGKTNDQLCRLIDAFSPPRTGVKEVIESASPVRSADVDRWWEPEN
jgi:quercetin dioxygenase-like cupin family protein